MSLFITSLNSGSNGNCYYIGNETDAILIDAGIPCREIENRLKRLGLTIQKIRGIFISHEHSDHIRGVAVLSKKYQLPVYMTASTFLYSGLKLENNLVIPFNTNTVITVGSICITPFSKLHDACDPCSFMVSSNRVNVGVFTDIGGPCKNVLLHFRQCHAAFLEANYDESMLRNGNYPWHLKKRISSGMGHLSNKQALEMFLHHRAAHMTHLFLSHLSKNNNCPKLVYELFSSHANGVEMVIASRYEPTPVYQITKQPVPVLSIMKRRIKSSYTSSRQLAFSF